MARSTTMESDALADSSLPPLAAADDSWPNCLVIVGACERVAPAVRRAVDKARGAVAILPALADFIELRFVSIDERPAGESGVIEAAARLAASLLTPSRQAPENFFALLVADDDASNALEIAGACAGQPVVEDLGAELACVAIGGHPRNDAQVTVDILGAGRNIEEHLADYILHFCKELTNKFGLPGANAISAKRLVELRSGHPLTLAAASEGDPEPRGPDDDLLAMAAPAAPMDTDTSDPPRPFSPIPGSGELGHLGQDTLEGEDTSAEHGEPPLVAPVFCAVVGDNLREWRKGRALCLGLHRQLQAESSAQAGLTFSLRFVSSSGSLAPSRKLRRRDLPRPREASEFFEQLRAAEEDLDRELAALAQRGQHFTRPVILLMALGAPPADVLSLEIYERLLARARILWLMVARDEELLSKAYREPADVLGNHPRVVDEVFERLLQKYAPVATP